MSEQSESRSVYYDRYFQRDAAKIKPGEFTITNKNTILVTVLGSCISVCLRDPVNNISGMNHFLLPYDFNHKTVPMDAARYGVHAMELMINDMFKLGAAKHRLQAKVFGGANVLSALSIPNIGKRNSQFVMEYLAAENIPVIASDVEGVHSRKIYFFPDTGEVKLKRLTDIKNITIVERESEYTKQLTQSPFSGGDITLFKNEE
jgi:chemotaxis protein CheD